MTNHYIASAAEDYDNARELFREYAVAINIDLEFQQFEKELANLQAMYHSPLGGIILLKTDGELSGCIAVRKFNDTIGEIKRMYVKPAFQNKGLAKILMQQALELAKDCNYTFVRLDTLNTMQTAIHLYKKWGFYEIPAYNYNPMPTVVYFEKEL